MQTVTVAEIVERLQRLSVDKLVVVPRFCFLSARARNGTSANQNDIGSLSDHAGFGVYSEA